MSGTPVYSAQLPGTPVGTLKLWGTESGLRRLTFRQGPDVTAPGEALSSEPLPPYLSDVLDVLTAYFQGETLDFQTIPLDLGALTAFQLQVYDHLRAIPAGKVQTYGAIAEAMGLGAAGARAVGQAVGANPVAVIVPCHRVVGSDGTLHGYSGGLHRKAALLRLEGIVVDGEEATSRVRPDELRLPL